VKIRRALASFPPPPDIAATSSHADDMPSSRRAARRATSTLILATLLPIAARAQQPTAAPVADSARVAANRVFATWTATDGPGCAVAVARDGRVVHQNGYGMANLETGTPITPASVFHLASLSKQFTAAAILLLARDGRLSLDDDVRKHLPEIPDYGHRITIRHLLTHTSGLRDQWDLLAMARGRFEENRITESDVLEIVARQRALNYVPGTEFLYSNTGYTLAGTIVRRVSGRSLRDFAEERIFRPLGMTQTQFQDDYTRVIPGRAAGYARRPTGRWHVSLPNYDTYGATSLFSDVGDLLRWQANLARPTVGDSSLVREMMALPTLANGDTSGYGLGLVTERYRGTPMVGHGGADAGYRTWLGRFPEHQLDVVVLCNAASSNPTALARSVADVFLPGTLPAAALPLPAAVAVTPEELRSLSGAFLNPTTGAMVQLSLRGRDTLIVGRTSGPALVPIGPRRFRVSGQPVEFEFTSDGSLREHALTWPARSPVTWRRETPAQPTAAQLAAYAGTYHSEELGATYTVTVRDSALVLGTRWANDVVVRPTYADAFAGPFVVTFTRRGGRVDGMTMSSGRVRRVRFTRSR
jgi:CubicO group peptidase (beta-lactamase class C family)